MNIDWNNDNLFFTYEWYDETSMFDDHPTKRWMGGSECYERQYKGRVPIAFKDCPEMIDWFLLKMIDDYPDEEGFWR